MQRRHRLLTAAGIATLLIGCSDQPTSTELLYDSIVITKHGPNTDFGEYKTFFLRPEIRVLKDDRGEDEDRNETLEPRYADPILDSMATHLKDRGYEQVDDQAGAELAVEMVYVSNVSTSVTCYSWWDPYYWGYPVWGYYPYYGTCSASTWRSNTLATNIVDLTPAQGGVQRAPGQGAGGAGGADSGTGGSESGGADTGTGGADTGAGGAGPIDKLLASLWFAGVYGIEYDYAQDNLNRALEGVDQAFAQSPYLTTSR